MSDLFSRAALVKQAARQTAKLTGADKTRLLLAAAAAIEAQAAHILAENAADVEAAEAAGIKPAFIDRLTLTPARVASMAAQLRDVAALADPCGETEGRTLPNGLQLTKRRVPFGVIGVIFESRPNVAAEAFAVCFKAGNAVILRGGKEAARSNQAIASALRSALSAGGCDENAVYCVSDTSRAGAEEMMRMNGVIDLLIPRGGGELIRAVVENATVPVIQTGVGNCHVYVDVSINTQQAIDIIVNAKTSRPAVCNAAEKLIIHSAVAADFLPLAAAALRERGVELRGNEAARAIDPSLIPATAEDWAEEYNDLIMAVAVVPGLAAALEHIGKYGSGHSETIITQNFQHAQAFMREVDAAAVYVNASTRFTDGGQFGMGAEVGISTQKLHARGPLGPRELTTEKYVIIGEGHVRA